MDKVDIWIDDTACIFDTTLINNNMARDHKAYSS